ncbi:MAG: hypothetical protein R2838_13115 [Caldilineaceae bacterium]
MVAGMMGEYSAGGGRQRELRRCAAPVTRGRLMKEAGRTQSGHDGGHLGAGRTGGGPGVRRGHERASGLVANDNVRDRSSFPVIARAWKRPWRRSPRRGRAAVPLAVSTPA